MIYYIITKAGYAIGYVAVTTITKPIAEYYINKYIKKSCSYLYENLKKRAKRQMYQC